MRAKDGQKFPKNYRSFNLNSSNLYKPVFVARPEFDDSLGALGGWVKSFEYLDSSIAIADTLGFLDERVLLTAGVRRQSLELQILQLLQYRRTQKPDTISRPSPRPSACWSNPGILCLSMATISKPWNADPPRRGEPSTRGKYSRHPSPDQIEFGIKFDLDGLGLTAGLFQIEKPNADSPMLQLTDSVSMASSAIAALN